MLVKLSALSVLCIFGLALLSITWIEQRSMAPWSTLTVVVAGYLVVYIAATALSVYPLVSLIGLYQRYGGLIPQLIYLSFALSIVGCYWNRPAALKELAYASVAGASVLSAYILIQAAGLDWISWVLNGARPEFPGGTMGNSNFAGGYLAIALPLSAFTALSAQSRGRVILGSLCGGQLLALWYTGTRGGMLALTISVLAVVFFARTWLPGWIQAVALAFVVMMLASIVLVVWHPGLASPPGPLASVRTSTLFSRISYWRAGLAMVASRPLLGTGPDTFYSQYPAHELAEEARRQPLTIVDKPHNVFLERATDSGLIGLLSYLALVTLALRFGSAALRLKDLPQRSLLLALIASFVAYLAQGFFSIDVAPLAFTGWVTLGAIFAIADPVMMRERVTRSRSAPISAHTGTVRQTIQVLVVLAAMGVMSVVVRPILADVAARRGNLAAAMSLQPLEPTYVIRAADLARFRAISNRDPSQQRLQFAEAESLYQRANRLQPSNINYTTAIALLNSLWAQSLDPARFEVAERWWQATLAANPKNFALREQYAGVREAMKDSLDRFERENGLDASASTLLGIARGHLALQDVDAARTVATRAEAMDPQDEEVKRFLDRVT